MSQHKELLNQVQSMFLRYGIKSVTMDDIARELGISKKTLYQVVDNKADLIEQIVCVHIENEKKEIEGICGQAKDAIDEMLSIARFILQQLRQMTPHAMYDLQKYYRDSWMKVEALHIQHVYKVIRGNLEWGMKEGLYRADMNADIIAKLYVAKAPLMVNEEVFPLRNYNKENLYREFIQYHIRGIASAAGLKLLDQYLQEKEV